MIPDDTGQHVRENLERDAEFQEAMSTYRYLVDMTVKYMLMFFGVAAFCLQQAIDESGNVTSFMLVKFAGWFGSYSSIALVLVIIRM